MAVLTSLLFLISYPAQGSSVHDITRDELFSSIVRKQRPTISQSPFCESFSSRANLSPLYRQPLIIYLMHDCASPFYHIPELGNFHSFNEQSHLEVDQNSIKNPGNEHHILLPAKTDLLYRNDLHANDLCIFRIPRKQRCHVVTNFGKNVTPEGCNVQKSGAGERLSKAFARSWFHLDRDLRNIEWKSRNGRKCSRYTYMRGDYVSRREDATMQTLNILFALVQR